MRGLYDPHGIQLYSNGVNPRAILALAPGVPVASVGLIVPGLKFLFDGAWFGAALVSFITWDALMHATAARARLAPSIPQA